MKLEDLIPKNLILDEDDQACDLELLADVIADNAYHYAQMLRAYHAALTEITRTTGIVELVVNEIAKSKK